MQCCRDERLRRKSGEKKEGERIFALIRADIRDLVALGAHFRQLDILNLLPSPLSVGSLPLFFFTPLGSTYHTYV